MSIPRSQGEQSDKALQEALHWLIALQEAPADAELRARFAEWLTAASSHATAWREARKLGGLVDQSLPRLAPGAKVAAPPHAQRTRRRGRLGGGLMLAALALAACLALPLLPGLLLRLQADHVTGVGETRTVRLADGSVVHLAADSAMAVVYGEDRRRIELLAGEAFFEVAPDRSRPFTVVAEAVEATALGTAFNVRLMRAGATVAVREGSVKVALPRASAPERLEPGDWLRVGWVEGAVTRGSLPPSQIAAWRNGQLVVKAWPLSEVAEALDRYHDGAILVIDDALAQRRVTGVYDLRHPLEALRSAVYSPSRRGTAVHPLDAGRLTPLRRIPPPFSLHRHFPPKPSAPRSSER